MSNMVEVHKAAYIWDAMHLMLIKVNMGSLAYKSIDRELL